MIWIVGPLDINMDILLPVRIDHGGGQRPRLRGRMNLPVLSILLLMTIPGSKHDPQGDSLPRHVQVYYQPGRFGGWPANHGIWSWGNEILVGFSAGYYQDHGPERHAIDHDRPEEHLLARSGTAARRGRSRTRLRAER